MFVVLVGVTLPSYIVLLLGNVVLNALNVRPQPAGFTIASTFLASLYILIFVLDPIVIMRNQDMREVLETITAKFRRRGREVASNCSNPLADLELQEQLSQN